MTEEKKAEGHWTRRRVITGAATGALVAAGVPSRGVMGQATGSAPPATAAGASPDHDVIVVGSGFAGATAARELHRAGLSVLVIEAQARAGGRTFTTEVDGHPFELGGAYVHWHQPHVWAEITRYGLEIEEAPPAMPQYTWLAAGQRKTGGPEQVLPLFAQAAERFFHDARQVFERPHDPLFVSNIAALDHISVADRLAELDLPEDARAILDGALGASCHSPLDEAGVVEMLRWFALAGFTLPNMLDVIARYTLRKGTRALLGAILMDARPELRLSTPVRALRQDANGVVVTTEDDEKISARAAVITVPLNVLGKIQFTPPLSAQKSAAAAEGHAGSGTKLHIQVRGRLPGISAIGAWPSPIASLATSHLDQDTTWLTAFGPSAKILDINDDAQVQAAVRRFLPDAEVLQALGYDWTVDAFVRGTWCVFRPGQLTRFLRELQRPEGRVVYAGADNANGCRGFIDGAIESGLRAARETVKLLG